VYRRMCCACVYDALLKKEKHKRLCIVMCVYIVSGAKRSASYTRIHRTMAKVGFSVHVMAISLCLCVCVCVEILRETEKERENLKKTNKKSGK
jgi:hypothetical protein